MQRCAFNSLLQVNTTVVKLFKVTDVSKNSIKCRLLVLSKAFWPHVLACLSRWSQKVWLSWRLTACFQGQEWGFALEWMLPHGVELLSSSNQPSQLPLRKGGRFFSMWGVYTIFEKQNKTLWLHQTTDKKKEQERIWLETMVHTKNSVNLWQHQCRFTRPWIWGLTTKNTDLLHVWNGCWN